MNGSSWELFDRVSADYDEVVPFFASFGAAIMATIDPPPGARLLDLGAGRGALTAPALARGCHVTAIDAAPGMVRRLAATFPDAEVHTMDAQALAFADDSFDVVASSFVIHLLDDPAAGVAEAYRVLKPGGRFAFTGGSERSKGGPTVSAADELGVRLNELFAEFTAYLPPNGSIGKWDDAADMLEDAGFVDLREDFAEVAIPFDDAEALWRWSLTHGYRAFIDDLPDARRAEFHDRMLALQAKDFVLRRVNPVWSGRKPTLTA
ncbi:ubiquinone/menaquinone biosynthesis C-methylase UbiE [Hamadaea flava]|uniref:Class I SAM-dependent methyltransferase n=1 Tax=Hamadaea flava TaxID=1742688 RepID=A0ABV8LS70_9ACTN|nr:class I SAM-dependent methyltransferase [Hamadaea flava]MCP2328350.1 ubiquinone/menaquinone biosynthesis C-methylase UbiE [Hamadaea flava]